MNKSKLILVLAFVTFTAFTFINPVYPHEQFLQHAGTVLLLIPLIADVMKDRMPMSAFVGILLFAILHVIGARYIYSNVPYKEWSVSLGIVDADFFQDTRNHYDRFVHLCFGVLLFPYLQYACKQCFNLKTLPAVFMAWLFIQTGSMVYELFEWLLTIVMSPEQADNYNGQQGDVWDAQKDMVLAMMGSTLMAVYYFVKNMFRQEE
jgi:putative membrane protein